MVFEHHVWFDRKPHQFGLYIFISVILEKDPHNISVLKLEMRHALDQFRGIVDRRLSFLQRENRIRILPKQTLHMY